MTDSPPKVDQHLAQLVLSLQMGAMQQLGKIASPVSGKIERDLTVAKVSIDMLAMIEKKTEGNLTDDEKTLIQRLLYELRMNYVDEIKKDETSSNETPKEEVSPESVENTSDEEAGADTDPTAES